MFFSNDFPKRPKWVKFVFTFPCLPLSSDVFCCSAIFMALLRNNALVFYQHSFFGLVPNSNLFLVTFYDRVPTLTVTVSGLRRLCKYFYEFMCL